MVLSYPRTIYNGGVSRQTARPVTQPEWQLGGRHKIAHLRWRTRGVRILNFRSADRPCNDGACLCIMVAGGLTPTERQYCQSSNHHRYYYKKLSYRRDSAGRRSLRHSSHSKSLNLIPILKARMRLPINEYY